MIFYAVPEVTFYDFFASCILCRAVGELIQNDSSVTYSHDSAQHVRVCPVHQTFPPRSPAASPKKTAQTTEFLEGQDVPEGFTVMRTSPCSLMRTSPCLSQGFAVQSASAP